MSEPVEFRPRPPIAKATAATTKAFTMTLTLGPFIVGEPAPVWADVAEMVIAECRREWEARSVGTRDL